MTDTTTVRELRATVDAATGRFLGTARGLTDADVGGPSALPGWTRGHVLTHLARNADAHVNLLTGARTGADARMYPSVEARNAAIEAGAGRAVADQIADIVAAVARLDAAADALDDWERPVVISRDGTPVPAHTVLTARLAEVELHHVDLAAGYTDIQPVDLLLDYTAELFARRADVGPLMIHPHDRNVVWAVGVGDAPEVLTGTARDLLGWLTGRGGGPVRPRDGELPVPPAWA